MMCIEDYRFNGQKFNDLFDALFNKTYTILDYSQLFHFHTPHYALLQKGFKKASIDKDLFQPIFTRSGWHYGKIYDVSILWNKNVHALLFNIEDITKYLVILTEDWNSINKIVKYTLPPNVHPEITELSENYNSLLLQYNDIIWRYDDENNWLFVFDDEYTKQFIERKNGKYFIDFTEVSYSQARQEVENYFNYLSRKYRNVLYGYVIYKRKESDTYTMSHAHLSTLISQEDIQEALAIAFPIKSEAYHTLNILEQFEDILS